MKKLLLFSLIIILLVPEYTSAHQPRLVSGNQGSKSKPIIVEEPEVSKAYYGVLKGEPSNYLVSLSTSISLYVQILVPDVAPDNSRRFSVEVRDASGKRVANLEGEASEWQPFYERYSGDDYLMGPDFKGEVGPGDYTIRVFNKSNEGKYVLVIGEKESFPLGEIINALILVPVIKNKFFRKPSQLLIYLSLIAIVLGTVVFTLVRKAKKLAE
jgi:hypothetical protein